MESVIIKSIKKKKTKADKDMWVVKMNGNRQATIGAWDSQLADYIEKDLLPFGINECECELRIKGDYTNIVDIKMLSPEELTIAQGPNPSHEAREGADVEGKIPRLERETFPLKEREEVKPQYVDKNISIVAQMCVKTAAEIMKADTLSVEDRDAKLAHWTQECVGAYHLALNKLE